MPQRGGTIKTRHYYLACRADKGIVDSLIDTAQYKGVTVQEIADLLGIELSERQREQLAEKGIVQ